MVREYPSPQILKQMASGQMPLPADPDKRMMIQKRLAKYEAKEGDQPPPKSECAARSEGVARDADRRSDSRADGKGPRNSALRFSRRCRLDKQDDVIEAMPGVRQALSVMGPPRFAAAWNC